MCSKYVKLCIFEAHFLLFLLAVWGNFSCEKGGVNRKISGNKGGVNKVSCRRGDSDFTLKEGGNGTLPPHAHVWGDALILTFTLFRILFAKFSRIFGIITKKIEFGWGGVSVLQKV